MQLWRVEKNLKRGTFNVKKKTKILILSGISGVLLWLGLRMEGIISQKGIELIKFFEGFSYKPYLCQAGVPTVGWGTTMYPNGKKVTINDMPITKQQAEIYLRNDIKTVEENIKLFLTKVLTQNQLNALISFAYNVGIGGLQKSTLLKKINVNPYDKTIREAFGQWIYVKEVKSQGLINRRAKEADLYFS